MAANGKTSSMFFLIITASLLAMTRTIFAYDPSPLQDICVADLNSTAVRVNGLPCKDPSTVKADDFFFSGMDKPGNTTNPIKATFSPVNVRQVPGANTLGLTIARLDFAAGGFLPPHFHPRASEFLMVLKGSMEVGMVIPSQGYKLLNKTLNKGDAFVVPVGLVHYQRNKAAKGRSTVVFAALNSQNPGLTVLANSVFGATPEIDGGLLAEAFRLDEKTVQGLQAAF
uniref:Germin-like protein n=1 Tax=Craterostigma plantagineum TaxID=4153 RepID=A0A7S7C2I8_CRAPL|nr:germin-like protein 1 [Craterostigma plantagineum]